MKQVQDDKQSIEQLEIDTLILKYWARKRNYLNWDV